VLPLHRIGQLVAALAIAVCGLPATLQAQQVAVDDLADPGVPLLKRPFTEGLRNAQGRPDHFEFDTNEYHVFRSDLHGTMIEVAVHTSAPAPGTPGPEEYARFVAAAFHAHWHVFGGYPYDRFAVKVRAENDLDGFSLSPVGLSVPVAEFRHPVVWEFTAHEMFHAFNGKTIRYEPNGTTLFQAETWIAEGATVYYSFRALGLVRGDEHYHAGMAYRHAFYRDNPDLDRSFADLANTIGESMWDDPADSDRSAMLYARGAMAAYVLDRELSARGSSLDALMRELYLRGIEQRTWSQPELPAIVESLVGDRLDSFFAPNVDGSSRVPVSGAFEFLRGPMTPPATSH
jgi:predicted metalloprotease with PDZ domain